MSIVRRRRSPVRRLEGYTASQRLEIGRRLLAEATRKQSTARSEPARRSDGELYDAAYYDGLAAGGRVADS